MNTPMSILVTGGAGFVGSHFVHAAHAAGAHLVVLDDLSAGGAPAFPPGVAFERGDIADGALVRRLLRDHEVTAVAHFAGRIAVGESVADPALYFNTNLAKTLALLDVVRENGPTTVLFSSTAAVYGPSAAQPIQETTPPDPQSPYGMSKLAVEYALRAYGAAYGLRWAALRYFNAAGAHPEGHLLECHDPETHLIPLAIDAALGRRPPLTIFGTDYPTPDGTCVRDYVHVCDLADAHLAAIRVLSEGGEVGVTNLGNGQGHSVRQVLDCCERVLGIRVPSTVGARRSGDTAVLVASSERARTLLGWTARRSSLESIILDAARSRRQT